MHDALVFLGQEWRIIALAIVCLGVAAGCVTALFHGRDGWDDE